MDRISFGITKSNVCKSFLHIHTNIEFSQRKGEHKMDKNIVWQTNKVTYEERCKVLNQKGVVVWFTGLSGSGKSTIAVEVERRLNEQKFASYLLDGDNIRHGINKDLGFSDEDRNENVRRISEIAALFQNAGIITLVAFISPFEKMREFAKETTGKENFIEVYVKANLETCRERDPKGLYKKQIANFTGIESAYEEPKNPDLILDTEKFELEVCVDKVLEKIMEKICYSSHTVNCNENIVKSIGKEML